MQSNDVRNIWIGGSSYRGDNSFTKLFTQKILKKKVKNNSRGHLRDKSDFLKKTLYEIPLSKTSYHIDQSIDMQNRNVGLCLVYTLFRPLST